MGFDEERYAREVLEPARLADATPPADLLVRYGLSTPLSAEQIARTLPRVLGCWRRARRELKYRRLVARLEADHAQLAPAFDRAAAGDLGPLRARIDGAELASRERTRRLRAEITDLAVPVGRITPELAAELAAEHAVPDAELAAMLHDAGVQVVSPDPLPRQPPVTGYPRYRDALRTLGCRHTADFLLHDRRDVTDPLRAVTVWDEVAVPGRSPVAPQTVATVDRSWAARPHDGSRTLASTVLVGLKGLIAAHGTAGIRDLVRYEIGEELRVRHRQGASAAALVDYAVDALGIARPDAQRIAFAVRCEPPDRSPAPQDPPADRTTGSSGGGEDGPARQVDLPPDRPAGPAPVVQAPNSPLPTHPAPPVLGEVTAERVDGEVVVRWQWPPDVSETLLRWRAPHGEWRQRTVPRGGYRSQDGAWLPSDETAAPCGMALEIEVVPVVAGPGGPVTGPPSRVTVPGQIQAWYEVSRTGPPWRRELSVVVRAARPAHLPSLRVVLRRGSVMPLHPADGEVLKRIDHLRLSPDRPLRLRLPVPRGPYWVRCFASDPAPGPARGGPDLAGPTGHPPDGPAGVVVELRDPPVAQLRGH